MPLSHHILIRFLHLPKSKHSLINNRPHPLLLHNPIHLPKLLSSPQHHAPRNASIHQAPQQRSSLGSVG